MTEPRSADVASEPLGDGPGDQLPARAVPVDTEREDGRTTARSLLQSQGPISTAPPTAQRTADVLLRAEGLSKSFKGVKALAGVDFKANPYDVAVDADAVVILTDWDQFRALDLDRIKLLMRRPLLIDLRNLYDPSEVRAQGFDYVSVGRR